jgi:threonine aldolase
MDFSSDTAAPAHSAVLEALARANAGPAASYGGDAETAAMKAALADILETDAFEAWPVASGTAANALALACLCGPTGAVICHEQAHIERDERGAPEFFTGGGKLHLLGGEGARIDPEAFHATLEAIDRDFVHETPPDAVSLTNLTECGRVYSADEIAEFAAKAHDHGLGVHLDGARLANALITTGASPADMTWRAGVDVVSLGLTKTGAMGCEVILLFGSVRSRAGELLARAKRAGHMPPKLRFLSAQARALLEGDLWLQLAGEANAMAQSLARVLVSRAGGELVWPVEGNEVFVRLPDWAATRLRSAGAQFYPWPGGCYRFVCAWTTRAAEIDRVSETLG